MTNELRAAAERALEALDDLANVFYVEQLDAEYPQQGAAIEASRDVLRAALAAEQPQPDEWRALAHQFDAHRMQALWHLRALLQDPQGHADAARQFLAAPPPPAAEPSEDKRARLLALLQEWQEQPPNPDADLPPDIAERVAMRLPEIFEGEPVPVEVTDAMVEAALAGWNSVARWSHSRERMRAAIDAALAAREGR